MPQRRLARLREAARLCRRLVGVASSIKPRFRLRERCACG
jgi:hypothetical protein